MNDTPPWVEPDTVAGLHLPPTFVADHAVRALAYQGAMTPPEIARHWHVEDAIAIEVVASLKAAGLIELDSAHVTFERGRVHLTPAGHERVAAARRRTWFAGALPVSLDDFAQRIDLARPPPSLVARVGDAIRTLAIAPALADEIGQAINAGATLALHGAAFDEQTTIAGMLGLALGGDVSLPFALYAAGAVVRLFDPRYHRASETRRRDEETTDVSLRSRESHARWATVRRPVVMLSGGVQLTDVLPAYDDDARFYVAPAPLAACHGLLAVLDSDAHPAALAELARLWLIPGRHHTGVLLLRSGERIEIPWRASTLLFGEVARALPSALRRAAVYNIDISELATDALSAFLTARFEANAYPPEAVEAIAALLECRDLATRVAAASACQYLRDRSAYEGGARSLTPAAFEDAVRFAADARGQGRPPELRAAS